MASKKTALPIAAGGPPAESLRLFRALLDRSNDSIEVLDPETGRFLDVNETGCRELGYRREEYLALRVFDVDPSLTPDAYSGAIAELRKSGKLVWMGTHRRKDGSVFPVEVSITYVRLDRDYIVAVTHNITERVRAEATLRESEERFRRVFEEGGMGMVMADLAESRFVSVNRAICEMLGYTSEEMLRLTAADITHPDDRARDVAAVRDLREGRIQKHTAEKRYVKKNGEVIWGARTLTKIQNADGQSFYALAVIKDITERKRAEAALNSSLSLLNATLESTADGILVVDTAGRITLWNQKFADMWQLPEAILSRHDDGLALQHVLGKLADPEAFLARVKELYAQPDKTSSDQIALADGRIFERYSHPQTIGGQIVGRVWSFTDVTEHRRVEDSHARLAMAVEQAAESIVITDTKGKILYANPAFEKTSGYTRAEALGQNPRVLKSGKQDAAFYRQMWDTIKRGEIWHGHFFNKRKDGTLYEEEATISPVRDAAGTVINYVAVKRDVTREMQLESQFRQSQKMEAFGQLAGGVAHDFNNILAVIQLQASLLKEFPDASPQQKDFAGEIEKAAHCAADLTRQLLLFSRKQALQPRDLDLSDVVGGITKMLQRIVGEDVSMVLKLSPQPLLIHADAGMMDQILMNLTVNARDAMPKGGTLTIETSGAVFDEDSATQHAQARPGAFACLSVTDTGCGIPPEILSRIFEPFFTTKEIGKGTGLGLATVFGIVQQHQGWSNVYSEPGHGTTFRVYLPRLTAPRDKTILWPSLADTRGGSETILLVEDDVALRAAVQKILSRLGYRVWEASAGAEALEIWRRHRAEIRLLLTDLVMPGGMSGIELAAQLLRADPKLKVIYSSGYSAKVAGRDFPLEEGVNFLPKPFEAHKLAQTVRNRLDRS